MLDLTLVSASWIVFALACVACVFLALRAVNLTPGVFGLVVLLGQQALATTAALVAFTAQSDEHAALGFRLGTIVWLLWNPFLALAATLLLQGSRSGALARGLAFLTGAPNLLLLAASIAAPSVLFTPDGALTQAAALCLSLVFVTSAWAVALLAREALTTQLPLQRTQLALLAAAFAAEGSFHAFQNAAKLAFAFDLHGMRDAGPALALVLALPIFILLPVLGWTATRAFASRTRAVRRAAFGVAGVLGAAGLSGALTAPLASGDEFRDPIGLFHALWDIASILLLVFAALRFQLVAIDARAKQSVALSFVVGIGFVVFGTVQAFAERFLQDRYLSGLPANDVFAALAVAVASVPLMRVGGRIGDRVFPDRKGATLRTQGEEIYEAALEGALLDGSQTPEEQRSLQALRAKLGLSVADHARIEARVRVALDVNRSMSPA